MILFHRLTFFSFFFSSFLQNPNNWIGGITPIDNDDVIINVTTCTKFVTPYCLIDGDTPRLASLTVLAVRCPTVVNVMSGTIYATQITIGASAKVFFNSTRVQCTTMALGAKSVISGSAVITGQTLTMEPYNLVLPGWLSSTSCDVCWPGGMWPLSYYGDFVFNFAEIYGGNLPFIYVKNLAVVSEMPGRSYPGLSYDRVFFNGAFFSNATQCYVISMNNINSTITGTESPKMPNNGTFTWDSTAQLITWMSVRIFQDFLVLKQNVVPLLTCKDFASYILTGLGSYGCTTTVMTSDFNQFDPGCPTVTTTSLSILTTTTTSTCAPQTFLVGSSIVSTSGNGNSTSTTPSSSGGLSPGMLAVAIAVPCAVVAGLITAAIIIILWKRQQSKFTEAENARIRDLSRNNSDSNLGSSSGELDVSAANVQMPK